MAVVGTLPIEQYHLDLCGGPGDNGSWATEAQERGTASIRKKRQREEAKAPGEGTTPAAPPTSLLEQH